MRRLFGALGGVLSIVVWLPLTIPFPWLPRPSTRLFGGRLKVPRPSATFESTTNRPVNVEAGRVPWATRLIVVLVPSLSVNDSGPGTTFTATDVIKVTVTFPAAVGEGSLSVSVAVGASVPLYSVAPASHAVPFIGRLSAYGGMPCTEASVLLMLLDRPAGIPVTVP